MGDVSSLIPLVDIGPLCQVGSRPRVAGACGWCREMTALLCNTHAAAIQQLAASTPSHGAGCGLLAWHFMHDRCLVAWGGMVWRGWSLGWSKGPVERGGGGKVTEVTVAWPSLGMRGSCCIDGVDLLPFLAPCHGRCWSELLHAEGGIRSWVFTLHMADGSRRKHSQM